MLPGRVPSRTLLTPPEPITAPRPDEQAGSPPPALASGRHQRVPRWTLAGVSRRLTNPTDPLRAPSGALDAALRSAALHPRGREAAGRATRYGLAAVPPPPLLAAPRHSRRSVDGFCSNTAKLSRATCNLHQMAAVVQALFPALFVFSVNRSANTAHFIHHFSPVLSTVLPGRCRPDGDANTCGRRGER